MDTSASIVLTTALSGALGLLAFQPATPVAIDHVILGIDDLEHGLQEFESRTGVMPQRGGEHPGRGTQNALVSLGSRLYLEILAPSSQPSPGAPRDASLAHTRLTPIGWALHTGSITTTVEQVRRAGFVVQGPTPGSRRAPDGVILAWQSAAVEQLGVTPFFIEWNRDTAHPSTTSPSGCTFVSLELERPSPERLELLFKAVGFAATVAKTDRPGMKVTLSCPRGRVEFGG